MFQDCGVTDGIEILIYLSMAAKAFGIVGEGDSYVRQWRQRRKPNQSDAFFSTSTSRWRQDGAKENGIGDGVPQQRRREVFSADDGDGKRRLRGLLVNGQCSPSA